MPTLTQENIQQTLIKFRQKSKEIFKQVSKSQRGGYEDYLHKDKCENGVFSIQGARETNDDAEFSKPLEDFQLLDKQSQQAVMQKSIKTMEEVAKKYLINEN